MILLSLLVYYTSAGSVPVWVSWPITFWPRRTRPNGCATSVSLPSTYPLSGWYQLNHEALCINNLKSHTCTFISSSTLPHSLFHAFQYTDFLSFLSHYFCHNHKKIQTYPGWNVHNVTRTHTWTLWCQFLRLGTRSIKLICHVRFCSNVAIEIWVLPKKIWIDKMVTTEITDFVFDLLELCAWGHSSLEHQLGRLWYNRIRVQTGHSQHLVIPTVTDDKPFEYKVHNRTHKLLCYYLT